MIENEVLRVTRWHKPCHFDLCTHGFLGGISYIKTPLGTQQLKQEYSKPFVQAPSRDSAWNRPKKMKKIIGAIYSTQRLK